MEDNVYINCGMESSSISGADVDIYTPGFMQGKIFSVRGGYAWASDLSYPLMKSDKKGMNTDKIW